MPNGQSSIGADTTSPQDNQSSVSTDAGAPRVTITVDGQRQYSTADIPPAIRARTVRVASGVVNITWDFDAPGFDETHQTSLTVKALKVLCDCGAVPGPFRWQLDPRTLWDASSSQQFDITFDAYMQDDQVLFQVMKQLHTHGLVFVTSIPQGMEDALIGIATRIGPMKDTFYGYTWDVRTVPAAINAAYTSNDLGFHTDLLYFQEPAHVQLLHCLQSSSSGGASLFVDAFKCAEDLFHEDEDAFNIMASVPVNYHYKHPDSNLYHTTKVVIETRPLILGNHVYPTVRAYLDAYKERQSEDVSLPNIGLSDCLERINWGPPFLAPFSLQEQSARPPPAQKRCLNLLNKKVDSWHAAARKFSALLHRQEFLHERLMKPGECVLFANTRVLHARRKFESGDEGKARWLKGGYVDKDPFLSKLFVLEEKYKKTLA